jgi:hypothetical protein
MNNEPLIQQALGDDWHKLPPVIQRHYQLHFSQAMSNAVTGTMHIHYPSFVKPMVLLARLMGGLIALKGGEMAVRVEKWTNADAPLSLFWKRTIQSPKGKSTLFASRMEYQGGNKIIEYIGCGFGLRLKLTVENRLLVYRSDGHLWQVGCLRIPIPDVLYLGHATITERAVSETEFELDFKISHPLFGETYRYGGIFQFDFR